jgi:acylglycerol lipase
MLWRAASALSLYLMLASCGTSALMPVSATPPASKTVEQASVPSLKPRLMHGAARMADGYRLPFQRWGHSEQPHTLVLGLHGFNDYSQAFKPLAEHLAEIGVSTYAFDQRGFGRTRQTGRWHGSKQLTADLRTLIGLLRARYPHARLILIGESMGAAVALAADTEVSLDVDGLVLIAPAVWSRDTMPWYQRIALSVAAQILPGLKLTGEGVPIRPSDNQSMLTAMSRDPLVIKATRVEALWGVTNLMDRAVSWPITDRGAQQPATLILYGEQDSIIPPHAFCRFIDTVALDDRTRLVLYADGWHMLPRDLQGDQVRKDIGTWLQDKSAALPSGEAIIADDDARGDRLRLFCAKTLGDPDPAKSNELTR